MMEYEKEHILDNQKLFYRIHKINFDNDSQKIIPGAFDPQPKGKSTEMSVDWGKYSTAQQTRDRAKKPDDNGVVSFICKHVRDTPFPLQVRHAPTLNENIRNQAHSVIFNVPLSPNDIGLGYRLKLRDICKWEIKINK